MLPYESQSFGNSWYRKAAKTVTTTGTLICYYELFRQTVKLKRNWIKITVNPFIIWYVIKGENKSLVLNLLFSPFMIYQINRGFTVVIIVTT